MSILVFVCITLCSPFSTQFGSSSNCLNIALTAERMHTCTLLQFPQRQMKFLLQLRVCAYFSFVCMQTKRGCSHTHNTHSHLCVHTHKCINNFMRLHLNGQVCDRCPGNIHYQHVHVHVWQLGSALQVEGHLCKCIFLANRELTSLNDLNPWRS